MSGGGVPDNARPEGGKVSEPWQEAETWAGDREYMSPIFTYGGVATIALHPEDCEGGAISFKVASDLRESATLTLTFDEAQLMAEWLSRAASEMAAEAVEE